MNLNLLLQLPLSFSLDAPPSSAAIAARKAELARPGIQSITPFLDLIKVLFWAAGASTALALSMAIWYYGFDGGKVWQYGTLVALCLNFIFLPGVLQVTKFIRAMAPLREELRSLRELHPNEMAELEALSQANSAIRRYVAEVSAAGRSFVLAELVLLREAASLSKSDVI